MGADPIIYIRADGNKDIAAGHLMRCLTIARELKNRGGRVCFLVSDADSSSILSENEPGIATQTSHTPNFDCGIGMLQLTGAHYRSPEQELPELTSLLQSHPGILLIDSYFVTRDYLEEVHKITKTAYLDDLQAFDYPVDLLINYDCFTDSMKEEYRHRFHNPGKMLLGAQYAPLRPQFSEQKVSIQKEAKNILITTGSSDPCHFALSFCRKLLQRKKQNLPAVTDYHYHIVVGHLNSDLDHLKKLVGQLPLITLHTGITDLTPLMLSCDLAITAGGTTLYELCALGIPSLSFSMADNQISNPKILDEQCILPYAGDIRDNPDFVLDRCFNFITEHAPYEKRKTVHTRMNSLMKGNGTLLIADAILNLASDPE